MRLKFLLLLICLWAILPYTIACQKQEQAPESLVGSEAHLNEVFEQFLAPIKAKKDLDPSALAAFLWTKEELNALLSHPQKEKIIAAYLKMKDDFLKEANLVFQDLYHQQSYQIVTSSLVRASAGKTLSYGDEALMLSLPLRPNLYTVRLKKNEADQEGFRINGWVYHQNQWKSFLKLGLLIDEINQQKQEEGMQK